jgi:hypothetical protein
MSGPTSQAQSRRISHRYEGINVMNDLFLLEPEYRYRANRTRNELRPVRYRRWRKRIAEGGPGAATNEKNWIS